MSGTELRNLHQDYRRFMGELGKDRGREEFPVLALTEFAVWWSRLDSVTRQKCENDFRKGYAAVIEEGEVQIAKVIAKYEPEAFMSPECGRRC